MTEDTTELDIYRPHLAEIGTQDGPNDLEVMLQEARLQKFDLIFDQCSVDMKEEWSQQREAIIDEAHFLLKNKPDPSSHRPGQFFLGGEDADQ